MKEEKTLTPRQEQILKEIEKILFDAMDKMSLSELRLFNKRTREIVRKAKKKEIR